MKYMSVKEAAAQWGVTIQMVRRYCQKGILYCSCVFRLFLINSILPQKDTSANPFRGQLMCFFIWRILQHAQVFCVYGLGSMGW